MQIALLLHETPGAEDDLHGFGLREDGKPTANGAGEEMRIDVFANAVSGACQDRDGE